MRSCQNSNGCNVLYANMCVQLATSPGSIQKRDKIRKIMKVKQNRYLHKTQEET
jgi:hypothetical protein